MIHTLRQRQGFTLIELLIVVAIIGVLAAIAIPNFLRFQLRARAGEGKLNLEAIRTAQDSYFAEVGTFQTWALTPAAPPNAQKTPWTTCPNTPPQAGDPFLSFYRLGVNVQLVNVFPTNLMGFMTYQDEN